MNLILSFLYNMERLIIIIYQFFQNLSLHISRKEKPEFRIFCIGYPKTGTTSIANALEILGYKTLDWPRAYIRPKKGWIDFFKKTKFDAFSDAPLNDPGLFKLLDNHFPKSKFIMTIRDEDDLIKSWKTFFYGTKWEITSEDYESHIRNSYRRHYKEVVDYFKDKPGKLLIVNIFEDDTWEKLCNFLDCKKPDVSFPHKNKGHYRKTLVKKIVSKQ